MRLLQTKLHRGRIELRLRLEELLGRIAVRIIADDDLRIVDRVVNPVFERVAQSPHQRERPFRTAFIAGVGQDSVDTLACSAAINHGEVTHLRAGLPRHFALHNIVDSGRIDVAPRIFHARIVQVGEVGLGDIVARIRIVLALHRRRSAGVFGHVADDLAGMFAPLGRARVLQDIERRLPFRSIGIRRAVDVDVHLHLNLHDGPPVFHAGTWMLQIWTRRAALLTPGVRRSTCLRWCTGRTSKPKHYARERKAARKLERRDRRCMLVHSWLDASHISPGHWLELKREKRNR